MRIIESLKNMRELKFRAWIKPQPDYDETGRMTPVSFLGLPMDDEHTWQDEEMPNSHGQTNDYGYDDDSIVMQWTGLQDKKGNDIYESDLLTDGDRIWEIKWRNAPVGFGMFMIEKPKKEFDGRLGRFTTSLMDYQCEKLEIVGNIYENPELL